MRNSQLGDANEQNETIGSRSVCINSDIDTVSILAALLFYFSIFLFLFSPILPFPPRLAIMDTPFLVCTLLSCLEICSSMSSQLVCVHIFSLYPIAS